MDEIDENGSNLIENNNEIKSVEKIIEKINEIPPPKPKRKYKKRQPKEVKIVPAEKIVEQVEEIKELSLNEDDLKQKLCEDLEVLKYKFEGVISYVPKFSYPESSVQELKRQKSLFMRLVQEKGSVNAVFESLCFVMRGGEKISKSLNLIDINGLTDDFQEKREEIIDILKECIDTGIIDCCELTPELKLVMLLTNITISRMEKNKAKRIANDNTNFLDGFADAEGEESVVIP